MHTEADLLRLIEAGETLDVEFKGEEREPLADRALVETVVCLANGKGGRVLIGVEDDGRVTGAQPRHGTVTDVRRLEALLSHRTVPPCPASCEVVRVRGHDVLVVEVPGGLPITATAEGVAKRRTLGSDGRPACLPFYFHEMQTRQAARAQLDPSAQPVVEARWDDLDPLEFERLRQTIRKNSGRADASLLTLPDEEIVKALGLGDGTDRIERLNLAGLLLLGREDALQRLVPTHEVAFQALSGTRVSTNDFFQRPLVRTSDDLMARFDARNEEQEMLVGGVRVGIPDYSRAGFREALHNALVHRDYGQMGTALVQWHDDRIEISSPGGFVEGVAVNNLLVTPPKPRNRTLADAFKRIGLVERTGRGVDTIFEGQLRYGRPAPDYALSSSHGVHVTLHGGPANLALARWIIERDTPARPVTVEEMLLINAAERERRIDVPAAAALVQRSESWARALLERLVEAGVLEGRGLKGRTYGLTAAAYRAFGDPAAYVRASSFTPLQHEQMILRYAAEHGRITREQAADLCQITPREARTVLSCLVERGALDLVSNRRWSFYHLPGHSV